LRDDVKLVAQRELLTLELKRVQRPVRLQGGKEQAIETTPWKVSGKNRWLTGLKSNLFDVGDSSGAAADVS
jgi:hypothetical protein